MHYYNLATFPYIFKREYFNLKRVFKNKLPIVPYEKTGFEFMTLANIFQKNVSIKETYPNLKTTLLNEEKFIKVNRLESKNNFLGTEYVKEFSMSAKKSDIYSVAVGGLENETNLTISLSQFPPRFGLPVLKGVEDTIAGKVNETVDCSTMTSDDKIEEEKEEVVAQRLSLENGTECDESFVKVEVEEVTDNMSVTSDPNDFHSDCKTMFDSLGSFELLSSIDIDEEMKSMKNLK